MKYDIGYHRLLSFSKKDIRFIKLKYSFGDGTKITPYNKFNTVESIAQNQPQKFDLRRSPKTPISTMM